MAPTQASVTRDIIRNTLKKCNTKRKDSNRKSILESIARGDNIYRTNVKNLPTKPNKSPPATVSLQRKKKRNHAGNENPSLAQAEAPWSVSIHNVYQSGGVDELDTVVANTRLTVGELCLSQHKAKTVSRLQSIKEHKKRMNEKEKNWDRKRVDVVNNIVSCITFGPTECAGSHCNRVSDCVKCDNCRGKRCWECDRELHTKFVLHERKVYDESNYRLKSLSQNEFLNENGEICKTDVFLSLFIPDECPYCEQFDTLKIRVGFRKVAVINHEGRFDINSTGFLCTNPMCGIQFEARTEDYTASGYWPGTADDKSHYLVCRSYLKLWYELQHKSPSISNRAVLQGLSNLSEGAGRIPTIDPAVISMAAKEFEYHNYRIRKDVLNVNDMRCMACGKRPLFCHCDANVKAYRFLSAGDHGAKALYEGVVFIPNDEIVEFVKEINAHIPQDTGLANCGNSVFKAGKADGSQFRNMDQTGFMSMSCRHNVVLSTADMYRGETYRLVAFFHMLALRLGILFFCYDVICRYWGFAQKIARLAQEKKLSKDLNNLLSVLVTKTLPFLSRFHGQAHAWFCQAIWFGHFQKYAAGAVGEEAEQNFEKLSKYASSTRRMTPANRKDHFSKAILYSNAEKNKNMVSTLTRRLSVAKKRVPEYLKKLNGFLASRNLQMSALPQIAINLVTQAKLVKTRRILSGDWPLQNLQKELEGVSYQMIHIRKKDMKLAERCKNRNPLRKKLGYLKMRSANLIKLINEKAGTTIVTEEVRMTGIFSWQTPGQSTIAEDFKLVDCWMLWKRFQEEINQTLKEMCTFIECVDQDRTALQKEVEELLSENKELDPFSLGKIALKNAEIDRLTEVLADAILYFKLNVKDQVAQDLVDSSCPESSHVQQDEVETELLQDLLDVDLPEEEDQDLEDDAVDCEEDLDEEQLEENDMENTPESETDEEFENLLDSVLNVM